MRAPVATLVLLSLLTFVVGLGRQAITDGDEGYYAEASREMVESGDWLTPHFNYTDRWQKPILYYWVTAATFVATGTSEWGARGFSAISGVLLVLLTYAVGRRMLGDADAAWIGAAITATCAGYFALARLALPDLPLALFVTLTIYLWLEGRPALAGAAAALGFLDKGPLAALLPVIVLLPVAWREHRWPAIDGPARISLKPADLVRAAAVFTIIAAPWYVAMVATHGRAYLESFFIGDNLERFATDRFNSPRALWFYAPIVVGGIFPWTAYLLVLPWRRAVEVGKGRAFLSANEWRLIIWTMTPLLFFTVSIGKQPRYILPILPPLALLLGASIARRVRQPASATAARGLAIATLFTAIVYFVLAILIFRAGPVLITAYPPLTLAFVVGLILAGLLLNWIAVTGRWKALPLLMSMTAVTALLALQFGAIAGVRPEPVEVAADLLRSNRTGSEPVGIYQTLTRNLIFYTHLPQTEIFDDEQAVNFLSSNERVLLVGRAQDVARLQERVNVPLKAIGSVEYVDPAAIRLSTLLFPLRSAVVTDVMVVSNR